MDDLQRAWDMLPNALQCHPGIKALHRAAEALRAAPPVVPLPADLIDMMTKRLKHERADLVGFTALGNEVGRAAKLDRWIAALEAAAPHPAQEGR